MWEIKKKKGKAPWRIFLSFTVHFIFNILRNVHHCYRIGTQRKFLRVLKVKPSSVVVGPTAWRRIFQGHFVFVWPGSSTSRPVGQINHRSPRLNPTLKLVQFDVVMAWQNSIFCDVMPCSFIHRYQLFGDVGFRHSQDGQLPYIFHSSTSKMEARDFSGTFALTYKIARPFSWDCTAGVLTHFQSYIHILFS